MGAFRTVIGCNMDQYETGSFEPTRFLVLDTQENKSVQATSTIAQQPLQSGDTMSDHMYRDPTTFSISGMFSLNGKNWDDDSYDFIQMGDRLTNVQEVFERIKDQGILCRITTIDEDDFAKLGRQDSRTRYKTRDHMALTSITWEERQNTVKYTFQFKEVIMVESQVYEELSDEEREDLGLPRVSSPVGSSLGTVLANTNQLNQIIIRTLYDNGYISDDWLTLACEGAAEYVKDSLLLSAIVAVGLAVGLIGQAIAAGLAAAAATAAASAAAAAAGSTGLIVAGSASAIVPVGTMIVAGAIILVGIGLCVCNFLRWIDKKKKETLAFKLVNNRPDQDLERLRVLLDDIEVEVNKVKTDLSIYTISGNYDQSVLLNIGGEFYQIEFSKSNGSDETEWSAKVTDMDNKPLDSVMHAWSPVSSFGDLNRNSNMWFRDKTKQYEVYLVNPSLSSEVNPTKAEMDAAKANLEGYSIWVAKGDIQSHVKKVEDAIENAIQAEGFI